MGRKKAGERPAQAGWATKVEQRLSVLDFEKRQNLANSTANTATQIQIVIWFVAYQKAIISLITRHLTPISPVNDWCVRCPPHNWPGGCDRNHNGNQRRKWIWASHPWLTPAGVHKHTRGSARPKPTWHLQPPRVARRNALLFNDVLNSISLRQTSRQEIGGEVALPAQTALKQRGVFGFFHSGSAFASRAMIGYLISRAGKYPRALWSSRIPFLSQHWGFIKTRSLSAAVN